MNIGTSGLLFFASELFCVAFFLPPLLDYNARVLYYIAKCFCRIRLSDSHLLRRGAPAIISAWQVDKTVTEHTSNKQWWLLTFTADLARQLDLVTFGCCRFRGSANRYQLNTSVQNYGFNNSRLYDFPSFIKSTKCIGLMIKLEWIRKGGISVTHSVAISLRQLHTIIATITVVL